MQKNFNEFDGKIAAFVSGGLDSMVMLDILRKKNADFFVVHVNHMIREEAASDCDFVRRYCKSVEIPFESYTYDVPALAAKSGRSIETEARLVRRELIKELISSGKADKVALAHHADDNAETVLMHILRGSGIDGLRGIREGDGVIRPLLDMTRRQISEYAQINGVPHVEDKTNSDSRYTRNFIRLEVLPLIKSRYPGAVTALNRLAENVSETIEALDESLDKTLVIAGENEVSLSLKALETPLAARYVIYAAKQLMPVDITRAQITGVLKLHGAENGKMAELAGGLKAFREYDKITFCFPTAEEQKEIPFSLGRIDIGGGITVEKVPPHPVKGETIVGNVPEGSVFRHRRESDVFTPYGGKEKSLKKYLIDKKIPARLRDGLTLLCLGSEVLAIVGVEISDKVKITDNEFAYRIACEVKE